MLITEQNFFCTATSRTTLARTVLRSHKIVKKIKASTSQASSSWVTIGETGRRTIIYRIGHKDRTGFLFEESDVFDLKVRMEGEELHGQTAIEEVAKSSDDPAKSGDNLAKRDTPAKSGDNLTKSDTPAKSGDNPAKSDTPAKSGDNPTKSGDNLSDSASISTEGVSSRKDHDSMGGSCAEVSSAAKGDQTSKDTDQTKDKQVVQDKTTNNEALPRHQESNKPDGQQDTDGEICDNSKLTLTDDLQDSSKEQSVTKASDTVNAASKLDGKSDSEKLSSDGKKHICENEDICEPSTSVHNDTLKPLTNKFVMDKPVLKVLGSLKDTVQTKQPSNAFSPVILNSAADKVVKGLGSSKDTVETKQPSNAFSPVTLNSALDKVVKGLGSSKDTVETKQPSNVFSPVTLNSAVDKVVKGLESSKDTVETKQASKVFSPVTLNSADDKVVKGLGSSKDTVETKQPSNVFSPVTLNSALDQVVKGLGSPEDTRGSKMKQSSNSSMIIDNSVSKTSGSSEDKAENLGFSEDTVNSGSTSKEPCQQSSAFPSVINHINESVLGGAEDPVDEGSEDEGALHIDCPEPGMSEGSNKSSDISQDAVGDKDMSDGMQQSERSSTQTDEMCSSRSPEAKETTNSTGLTDSLGQSGDTEKTVESTSDKTQGCNIFDSFKTINTANDNMKSQSSVRNLESSALKLTDLKIKLERYKALNRTWQTRNPDRTNLFESFSANIPTSKDMDENSLQKDGDSRSEHKSEEQQEKAKEKDDLNSTGHESVCINSEAKNTSGGGEIAGDKSMELTRSTDKTHKDHNVFKTHKEHNFADDSTALQQELASLNDLLGSNTGDVSRKVIQENPSMPNLLDIGQKSKPNFKNKDMQKSEQEHKSKENVPVNEEELSEEEQNLKICEIFSLQAKSNSQENESQKKISKEPANTKTNHNESLMDILNLDKDYTASAQPTPVPQKPADVNWGVMGANRCQRCNFTTSDESLLQVHTCRRQSLGSQNPSTPPARQPLPSETSKTSTPPQISSHKSAPQAPISSTSGTKTIQPKKTTQKIKILPPTPKVFGKDIVCRIISLGNEKFLCTLCKYTETVPVFVGHLVEHMQEFPYSCPYCTEKGILLFQTSAQITAHINSHTQAQPKFNIFSFSKAKAFLEECKARGSNTLTGIWIEPNKVLTSEEAVRNSSRKILPNTSQRVAVSTASTLPQANSVHSTASVQNRVPASTSKGNPYLSNPAFQSPPNVDVSNKLISNLLASNTTGNPNPAFQGPPNVAGSNKFISNILASNTTGNPNPAFQGPPNVDVSNNFISNFLASNTTGNQLLLLLPTNPSGTQQIVQPRNILPSTIQSTPALTTTGANVSSMHQSSTQQSAIPLSVTQQIVQPRNILPSTIQSTQALNTKGANVSSMHQSCTQQSAIPLSVASITAIPSNVVLPTKVTLATGGVPTSAVQALIPRTQTPANTLSSAAPSTSVNTSPSVLQAAGVRTLTPANSSSQTFPAFVPSVSGLATSTSGPQVTGARAGTPTTSTTLSAAASVTSAITVPRPTTAASSQPNLSKVMVARNGKRFLLSRNGNRWLCNGYPGECKFSTELLPLFKAHILNHLHEYNEACQHPSASQNGELSQTCPHVEQVIKSFTDEKTDRPPSSSAIPNQDLKDTASGSSGSTEPSPAIQKAEDDGSDSDCEVIEVAKKEAPLIDLTEDDPPESSEKAGISNDHSSTTSEPELRIGTSFSLRSNENVSAEQTIPDNEANTQGANTTQPVERRPNTPMPTGQGVQPEQDDQRKSMFYVCGFADCMFSCNLSEQFKHHILNNHRGADVFPCAHCAYRSPGQDELFRHMNSHTATKMFLLYKCGFSGCRFGTNLLSEFTQHNQIFHKAEDWYGCASCKNKFVSLEELLKHLQTSVLKFIQCPHCTVKNKERRIILQHITESHPGKPRQITVTSQLICNAPNLPFRRAGGDPSKNKSSSGRPKSSGASSSAKEANKQSSSQDLTSKGMEKRESETIRSKSNPTCPQRQIISDSFGSVEQEKSSKHLEGHVRMESRSPDSTSLENVCLYSCPSCKKSFIRYQVMEKHIIQCHPEATEIVLYKCKNCPFSSTTLNSTETHWTKIHSGTSQILHQKRIIGQSLTQESRPSELHQAVDFLHCDHCSFTCNSREEFIKHELSHDPEREESHASQNVTELSPSNEGVFQLPPGSFYNTAVKCPHCKYTSKARVSLLRHLKLHQSWKDQNSEGSTETLHGKQIPVAEGRVAAISSTSETSILAGNIDKVASTKTGKYDINPAGKSPSSGLTFYKCKFCSFKSPNLEGFNKHLRTHRSKTHFKCEYCSFKCNNSTNMFKHQKKEHEGMSLKYKEVDTSTGKESLIESPNPKTSKRKSTSEVSEVSKKQKTGQSDNECTFCGVVASSISSLEEHFKKIHGVKAFTCDKCKYITYELPLMEKHFADAHQQQKVVYKMSPSTPSKSQKKASNVHEQKCYRCGLCSVITPTEDGFNEHSQYKHSSEQPHLIPITVYTCNYCSRRFKFLANAEEHATSCDTGAAKESVDTVAESNSKVHTTPSHSQQGLHQEEAGKQVSPSHSETKKSNYKYPCQKCDYSTTSKVRIRTHYYSHNNYRPYKCTYCAYCSNRSDKVSKHMSSKHPEEKINIKVVKDEQIEMTIDLLISEHRISFKRSEQTPSPAPTAGSPTDFAESETKSVNDNAVKSTSQKHFDPSNPFHCKLCNFTTASKQSLHLHIQRQHNPPRLMCKNCDFKSTYLYQMRNHFQKSHPTMDVDFIDSKNSSLEDVSVGSSKDDDMNVGPVVVGKKRKLSEELDAHDEEFIIIADEDTEAKTRFPLQDLYSKFQDPTGKAAFKCLVCAFRSLTSGSIVDHIYTHFPRCFQCIHCEYRAYPSSAVSAHLKSNHDGPRKLKFYKNKALLEYNKILEGLGKPPYEIPEPKKVEPPSIDEFQDVPHKKKKKNKTKRSARVLWSDSDSDSDQAPSVPSVPSVPKATTFCCHLCKYKAKDLNQFAEHLSMHKAFMNSGRKEVSKCGFCSFTSSDPTEFNEHVERHVSERPFRCSHCGYACFSKAQVRNHIKCKHPGKKVNYTDRSDENTVHVRGPTPEPTSVNFNVKVHLVDIWCLPMKQFDEMVLSNGLGSANLGILSHEMFLDLYKGSKIPTDQKYQRT